MKKFLVLFLIVIGFWLRYSNLNDNHSFWSDEAQSAVMTRALFNNGIPRLNNGYSTGLYQCLHYIVSAFSANIFGLNEFSLRLPAAIFGVLTIGMVYLLGITIFRWEVGFLSAFLVTFLDVEILWSRQARPYQTLQFIFLLAAFFIVRWLTEKKVINKYLFIWLILGVIAFLFHPLGLLIFPAGMFYFALDNLSGKKKLKFNYCLKDLCLYFLSLVLFFILITVYFNQNIVTRNFFLLLRANLGKTNNFNYYRIFLTRNYFFLTIFTVIGFLNVFTNKGRGKTLPVIFLGTQLFIISFFLKQPFMRYFYIVFPFIILLASYGILEIRNWILDIGGRKSSIKYLISNIMVLVVVFSLWKTDKLSLLPKKIYSLNADMQEIPETDWKNIYHLIKEKMEKDPKTVLVANWNDLPIWYLGEGSLDFLVRKSGQINDHDPLSGALFLPNMETFLEVVAKYDRGLVVLDSWDDVVSVGIREYCHDTLKLEFEIDRAYPTQPRYWTVWVYSWGY